MIIHLTIETFRKLYHLIVPLNLRLKLRSLRMRLLSTEEIQEPQVAPPQLEDTEKQIIELLQPILTSRTLENYSDVWKRYHFTITPHYNSIPWEISSFEFSANPLAEQVRNYPFNRDRSWLANAEQAAAMAHELIQSGRYRDFFELWAAAGFHITPQPPPAAPDNFLPNVFILGAAKCGTTTLHAYLEKIPSVCMSRPKEPFFFEAEYELGLAHYQRLYFSHWQGEPIIGEARHRNLYLPYIPKRIHDTNPNAKLIVMVRNPIERAYSHWWHWYSRGVELLDFEEAIAADHNRIQEGYNVSTATETQVYQATLDQTGKGIYRTYLDSGYYFEQIERYLQFFPRNHLKVIYFEDLVKDPLSTLQDLEKFLGVSFYTSHNFEILHLNPAAESRQGIQRTTMNDKIRAWLVKHYHDHNDKLANFTGRNLSDWI
ncbi:MAG TPA: sulfotransferase domain-containing protein [Oceanobacillus sp.]|nr:sulfotransferase domain-containing protein [Oceanobacillus sp.]